MCFLNLPIGETTMNSPNFSWLSLKSCIAVAWRLWRLCDILFLAQVFLKVAADSNAEEEGEDAEKLILFPVTRLSSNARA